MNKLPFSNITVFILFFGLALLEAIKRNNWIEAIFFLAIGFLFLRADFFKK